MVFLVLLDWLTGYTAQEILPNCRQLIIDHMQWCNNTTEMSHPMPCVFGDMTEVLPPDTFTEGNFMKKVYRANKMPMMTHQHCYTHNKFCPSGVRGEVDSDYDLSGLPCPDMSPAGLRLGPEGPTSKVFISHAKLHIARQTPLLIIENVPETCFCNLYIFCHCFQKKVFPLNNYSKTVGNHLTSHIMSLSHYHMNTQPLLAFPHAKELSMAMIKTLYSRHYDIRTLFVSPADQGHAGIARDRVYVILALKGRVEEAFNVENMYAKVSAFIRKRVQTVPSDYLISDYNELQREAQATATIRGLRFSPISVSLVLIQASMFLNSPQLWLMTIFIQLLFV